jgi:GTPase SAR1 family protein
MPELLVLGGEGSGKSLLIRRLKEVLSCTYDPTKSLESTLPTVGVELNSITVPIPSSPTSEHMRSFNTREIGSTLSSRWENYIPECSFLIFVVDVFDAGRLAATFVLLHEALSHLPTSVPVLLCLNKVDMVSQQVLNSAQNFLNLDAIQKEYNFKILTGSCLNETLATGVINWIQTLPVPR